MQDEKIQPTKVKKTALSPLWLFTLVAMVLAGWLLYKSVAEAGTRISIFFDDAQGLQAGRTAIRYQGLDIGIIKKVRLNDNLTGVIAEAEIFPQAKKILSKDTLFWVVKPTATLTEISGLDTLVRGNYIAVLPGEDSIQSHYFIATPTAPQIIPRGDDLLLTLETQDLGSLSIGSKIYYKKIAVGEIYNYTLDKAKQSVLLFVKIQQKYADLVKTTTRFWNISGIKADIGLQGAHVEVENLFSLLAGGIAFDSPTTDGEVANNHLSYSLYPSINEAKRGIAIRIALPLEHGIKQHHQPISYQGTEVGKIENIEFNQDYTGFIAKANIDPSMDWLLTSGSKFVIEAPQISLSGVKNVGNLLTGNSLSLQAGKGEPQRQFIAETAIAALSSHPDTLRFSLNTNEAWGITQPTKILYRGIEVGFIDKPQLSTNGVKLDAVVYSRYRHLVKSQSRFYRVSGISGSLNKDGLEFSIAPAAQLAQAAISFISEGSNKAASTYYLYASKSQAESAKTAKTGVKKLTLTTSSLPSIAPDSPVMYKNVTVGRVNNFTLEKDSININVEIDNQYAHLITNNTVFWDHSGINIEASLAGVNVQTGSLSSIITGGISFAELKGVNNKKGQHWLLYKSLNAAQNQGVTLRFTSSKSYGLKKGSDIRFQGVKVGEVTELKPLFEQDAVEISANISPSFSANIAKDSSYFWVSRPVISLAKAENLDSLFTPYISVLPGKGKTKQQFTLHAAEQFIDPLTLVLEAESRNSINEGTPILFRDFAVGSVTKVQLGRFADRVLIEVKIKQAYKHLVRSNTVFWNNSGIDVSIGLTGADIKTGTAESLLQGGISFATPTTQQDTVAPLAKQNQHFLLHTKPKPEWKTWRTAIPPALKAAK